MKENLKINLLVKEFEKINVVGVWYRVFPVLADWKGRCCVGIIQTYFFGNVYYIIIIVIINKYGRAKPSHS